MLADACHKRHVPLCLYSSIADLNHLNYPNQGRHHELEPRPQDAPDWGTRGARQSLSQVVAQSP
jgi:alpha-L-fucosidase